MGGTLLSSVAFGLGALVDQSPPPPAPPPPPVPVVEVVALDPDAPPVTDTQMVEVVPLDDVVIPEPEPRPGPHPETPYGGDEAPTADPGVEAWECTDPNGHPIVFGPGQVGMLMEGCDPITGR